MIPVLTKTSSDDIKTPTLWTDNYKGQTLELWTRIFSLQQIYPDRLREVLLTMTSVLCPLLPHLIEMTSNVVVGGDVLGHPGVGKPGVEVVDLRASAVGRLGVGGGLEVHIDERERQLIV